MLANITLSIPRLRERFDLDLGDEGDILHPLGAQRVRLVGSVVAFKCHPCLQHSALPTTGGLKFVTGLVATCFNAMKYMLV